MFSVKEKQYIAEKIEGILLGLHHPEMPPSKPSFQLHVGGAEDWSWADIIPNWKCQPVQEDNLHNEIPRTRPAFEAVAESMEWLKAMQGNHTIDFAKIPEYCDTLSLEFGRLSSDLLDTTFKFRGALKEITRLKCDTELKNFDKKLRELEATIRTLKEMRCCSDCRHERGLLGECLGSRAGT